jgi:hypothetical protein
VRVRVVSSVLAATTVAAALTACAGPTTLTVSGLIPDELLGQRAADSLVVQVTVQGSRASALQARLDGRHLPVTTDGAVASIRPTGLADGAHLLVVAAGGATVTRSFRVDRTPPTLTVDPPATADSPRSPVTLSGVAEGAVRVTAADRTVAVTAGRFTLTVPTPPQDLVVTAVDAAGNASHEVVTVAVRHPPMRGVHLTGYGWNDPALRDPVLALARQHRIDPVEVDLKEEDGYVDYASHVPLARQIHAVRDLYDLRQVVAQLHALGVRVVGRIVCFRDPKLASWAWAHGHRDWDVQSPSRTPYKSAAYGAAAFTNWAADPVRAYNIAIAVEAARAGFDDIMFDYVRRPDGPLRDMRFPGAHTDARSGVTAFVREASAPIHAAGAFFGLAVFGVSATRPSEVGQDISAMARWVDYVAPMVYPSHWAAGEYGVRDPNAQPFAIVNRSLRDFQRKVAGTGAQVMPWLQDFSLGVTYTAAQVRAQIAAAARDGIPSFLLWNAACVYHRDALAPSRH